MKIISVSILVVLFLWASLTGWKLRAQPDIYVIGGTYVLHTDDVVYGNLRTLFAQVTLEDGARVQGAILSVSSALDIGGSVGGGVVALGSDITVRRTGTLTGDPHRVDLIPYVVLLPQIAQIGNMARQPQ